MLRGFFSRWSFSHRCGRYRGVRKAGAGSVRLPLLAAVVSALAPVSGARMVVMIPVVPSVVMAMEAVRIVRIDLASAVRAGLGRTLRRLVRRIARATAVGIDRVLPVRALDRVASPPAPNVRPSGLKPRGDPIDDDDMEEMGAPCDIDGDMLIPPPPPMRASAVDTKAASASSAPPMVSDVLMASIPYEMGSSIRCAFGWFGAGLFSSRPCRCVGVRCRR